MQHRQRENGQEAKQGNEHGDDQFQQMGGAGPKNFQKA
jgi:hypothetical protein